MADRPADPELEIAGAIGELSEQTRRLVRSEIEAARRETWRKARESAPVMLLGAAGALSALLAGASAYRFSMRVLERLTSPGIAALLATAGYGTGAALAAGAVRRRLDALRPPLPSETARQTVEAAGAARDSSA